MIIVSLYGGIGNQLFQYALGRRLALENNVPLKLDLSWFRSQVKRRYCLDHFRINAEIATSAEVRFFTKNYWPPFLRKSFESLQVKYPRWLGQIITYKGMSFYPKALQVSNQTYLNGYWQSEEYFASISPVIRHEVQLKAPFSLENNHWVEKASQPFAVSVHIRRADYVHDTLVSSLYSVCTPDYYRRAAAFLIQKIPQAFFVIFSDDLPWAHKNLDILSPACFVDAVGSRKDEEELMMMSLCRHHIIANSSFSWWGAWLGEKKGSYIIVPNQWFNKLPYPEDLVPERWMKI